MTTEHLMLLEPADFRAVRIQCSKCGAAASFQLDQTIRVPNRCAGCGEDWSIASESDPAAVAQRAVAALKKWMAYERQAKPDFRLAFELSPMGHMAQRPATPK